MSIRYFVWRDNPYLLSVLSAAGLQFLTDTQKDDLRRQKAEWDGKQDSLREELGELERQLADVRARIGKNPPSVPGANMVHTGNRFDRGC